MVYPGTNYLDISPQEMITKLREAVHGKHHHPATRTILFSHGVNELVYFGNQQLVVRLGDNHREDYGLNAVACRWTRRLRHPGRSHLLTSSVIPWCQLTDDTTSDFRYLSNTMKTSSGKWPWHCFLDIERLVAADKTAASGV